MGQLGAGSPTEAEKEVKQYELWWAQLPEPVGRRPVLLLTRDGAYSYLSHCLAAEITTTIRGIPQEVSLGRRDGLPTKCAANFDNLHSIRKSSLQSCIGSLSRARVGEVKRALGAVLAWPELVLQE